MKMRTKVFFIISLLAIAVSLHAAEDEYDQPREDEVILVVRVVITPEIDDAFYSQYWDFDSNAINMKRNGSEEGETIPSEVYLNTGSTFLIRKSLFLGNVGQFASMKVSIPKDRVINMDMFSVFPASIRFFKLYLPIFASFKIPEGDNYIYLGTFEFEREGNQFEIVNVNKYDEFDKAKEIISERYGSAARLVRVPLQEQKD